MNYIIKLLFLSFAALLISTTSFARGGSGGHSLGLGFGLVTASQDDLESQSIAVNQLGRSATKPGSALEFEAHYEYRFSGTMFAMQLRPSYFTQNGNGGTDKTSLIGYTFFPMLKMYPLENSFIHFYMQIGLGYGNLKGKIEQPSGAIEFGGGAFGALGGLGAQFCFTDTHCMFLEGNFRYLPIERNLVSSDTTSGSTGFSQNTNGQELEFQSNDLKTTMSGIMGSIGYNLNF